MQCGLAGVQFGAKAVHKLAGSAPRAGIVALGPLQRAPFQVPGFQGEAAPPGHGLNDGQVLLLIGSHKGELDAEAVGQRDFFLQSILAPDLVTLQVVAVREELPNQVAAVGGGVDHHVAGSRFQASFQHGLQGLVLSLPFLE